jgi:hypothetical protein
MHFESFIAEVLVLALLDSGATNFFVSLKFCRDNGLRFRSFPSSATLADSSSIAIVGELSNSVFKMDSFRPRHSFLVVDMSAFAVVLGIIYLSQHNPVAHWKERFMAIGSTAVYVRDHSDDFTRFDFEHFEICSFKAFSRGSLHLVSVVLAHLSPDARETNAIFYR